MQTQMASITIADIMNAYAEGGRHDGIMVYTKFGRAVGFITDLRVQLYRELNVKYLARSRYLQAKEEMPAKVEEAFKLIQGELMGTPAKVFINQTQPNVHIADVKFYFVVPTMGTKIRLGISHRGIDKKHLCLPPKASLTKGDTENHVYVNGLTMDEGIQFLKDYAADVILAQYALVH